MEIEIILSLLGGVISLLAGSIASSGGVERFLRKLLRIPERPQPAYSERLSALIEKLSDATRGVDQIIEEIASVAETRQRAVGSLEADLQGLETKESQLRARITVLENTPVEAAEHFASLVSKGERRSARRDYLLFGAGVVVSTVMGIALQFLAG
jgi:hypothetical protein